MVEMNNFQKKDFNALMEHSTKHYNNSRILCFKCGRGNSADAVNCQHCGTYLKKDGEPRKPGYVGNVGGYD